jgi:hypothetical protein
MGIVPAMILSSMILSPPIRVIRVFRTFHRSIPAEQRIKPISVVCTDTRVEIPAIVDMVEGTLGKMRKFSEAKFPRPAQMVCAFQKRLPHFTH